MSWILMKNKGVLLRNGTLGCHQAFANTMTGRKRHLNSCGLLPNGGHDHFLGLFCWTVAFACGLSLQEQLKL